MRFITLERGIMHPLLIIPTEWVLIIIVLAALLLFGGSRLSGLGKGAGRAIREFKEETEGLTSKDKHGTAAPLPSAQPTASAVTPPPASAEQYAPAPVQQQNAVPQQQAPAVQPDQRVVRED